MNNKFCPVPWSHLQVEPNGAVRPCCMTQSNADSFLGNINDTPLEDIWNSDRLRLLRQNILSGKGDDVCSVCYKYDDAGLASYRQHAVNNMMPRLSNVEDAIRNTNEHGHCSQMNLEYWDFRFSNLCNFKCRSCGPAYSTAWYPDAVKVGWSNTVPDNKRPITWMKKVEDRVAVLEKHIDSVKEIYFAGGEPLLMEEHYRVLDLLIAAGKTDVKIRYNTNMSTLVYRGKDVIKDYWSHFSDVEVSGSLDVAGKQAEYVRSGTKWASLDTNIRKLCQASKEGKIKFYISATISNMTIFYLQDLLEYLLDVGVINKLQSYNARPWQMFFNLVFSPEHYCIQNMPDSAKEEIRAQFNEFDQKLKNEYGVEYSMFTELYPILDIPADPYYIELYKQVTKELDRVRGEDVAKTLPRLWKHYERDGT